MKEKGRLAVGLGVLAIAMITVVILLILMGPLEANYRRGRRGRPGRVRGGNAAVCPPGARDTGAGSNCRAGPNNCWKWTNGGQPIYALPDEPGERVIDHTIKNPDPPA